MTAEIIALAVDALVSILIPLIVIGIIVAKNKQQWKSILGIFICGAIVYVAMQWGIKEHGLTWLFNNTKFMDFMNAHYLWYLLVVAFAGAVLVTLAQLFVVVVLFRRKVSYVKALAFAMGYSMTAATMLIGIRSVNTIIELVKGTELEMDSSVTELLLSGYERLLIFIIEAAIITSIVYFVEKKKALRGGVIAVFFYTMLTFLPGFFLAFTLPDFFEVFDRSIALAMIYVVLTASAVAGIIILKVLKNSIYSD